jgi:endonuclease/exonuclease/phosphatase family metal-dependent hydrolase
MTERLRVASFNIRTSRGQDGWNSWPWRRRACAAAIEHLGADVVGLQEVRPSQLRYLRRRFRSARFYGRGRDADGGGEHAAVLLSDPTWAVDSSETRWLASTPAVPGSRGWDAHLPRVATIVRLDSAGSRIGVVNAHFDHSGRAARRHSADLVLEWIAAEPERDWLVLGDLNAVPGSPVLAAFADAGFRDALAGVRGGTQHGFSGATDRTRIDHVLVGPRWTVLGAEIRHDRPGGRLPSDHWPVVADLALG